jgi:hypothetical protein
MPLPDGWFTIVAPPDLFSFTDTSAGTYTSTDLGTSGIIPHVVIIAVYAPRIDTGTTFDLVLQTSDNGITWTSAPGTATPTLAAPGSVLTTVVNPGTITHLRGLATITGSGLVTATITALVTIR